MKTYSIFIRRGYNRYEYVGDIAYDSNRTLSENTFVVCHYECGSIERDYPVKFSETLNPYIPEINRYFAKDPFWDHDEVDDWRPPVFE
jgi:hypothetical protein